MIFSDGSMKNSNDSRTGPGWSPCRATLIISMRDTEFGPERLSRELALWRRLRNEARALASEQDDFDVQHTLLRIASEYNELAQRAERKLTNEAER